MMWILSDWPGANLGTRHWTRREPPAVVTRQLPSVLVADTIRSSPAGSVSVTRAGRRTALPVFRTEIVNLTRCPTVKVAGAALLRRAAFASGSGGAVRHLCGKVAVAVATRTAPPKLTVQVTAWELLTPVTVNAL